MSVKLINILDIPNELMFIIADYLTVRDLVALKCSNRRFSVLDSITPKFRLASNSYNNESTIEFYKHSTYIPENWKKSIICCTSTHKFIGYDKISYNNNLGNHLPAWVNYYYNIFGYTECTNNTLVEVLCGSCKMTNCNIENLYIYGSSKRTYIRDCDVKRLSIYCHNYDIYIINSFAGLKHLECDSSVYDEICDKLPNLESLIIYGDIFMNSVKKIKHRVDIYSISYDGGVMIIPESYMCKRMNIVVRRASRIEIPIGASSIYINGHSLSSLHYIQGKPEHLVIHNISSVNFYNFDLSALTHLDLFACQPIIKHFTIDMCELTHLRTDIPLVILYNIYAPKLTHLTLVTKITANTLLPYLYEVFTNLKILVIYTNDATIKTYLDNCYNYPFKIYSFIKDTHSTRKSINYPLSVRYRHGIYDEYANIKYS